MSTETAYDLRAHILALTLPAAAILAAQLAGFWVALGAHPWWALSGAMTGLGIGFSAHMGLALTSRFGRVSDLLLVMVFAGLALVALILMLNGKESFAMSYASDALSGRFWHLGYIGFIAALYAALVSAFRALWPGRR